MSEVYPKWRERMAQWIIESDTPASVEFVAFGVNSTYVPHNAHSTTLDIPENAVVTPASLLENITYVDGFFKCDDVTITGYQIGVELKAIVIGASHSGGTELVAYLDNSGAYKFPNTLLTEYIEVKFAPEGVFIV